MYASNNLPRRIASLCLTYSSYHLDDIHYIIVVQYTTTLTTSLLAAIKTSSVHLLGQGSKWLIRAGCDMFAIVVKGFINQRQILECPGYREHVHYIVKGRLLSSLTGKSILLHLSFLCKTTAFCNPVHVRFTSKGWTFITKFHLCLVTSSWLQGLQQSIPWRQGCFWYYPRQIMTT